MANIEAVILPNRNFTVMVGREFMNTAYSWGGTTLEKHAPNAEARSAKVASISVTANGSIKIQFEVVGEGAAVRHLRPPLAIMNEPHLIVYGVDEESKEG